MIATNINMNDLESIPSQETARGSLFKEVKHLDLVNAVLDCCMMRGWKFDEPRLAVSKNRRDKEKKSLACWISLTIDEIDTHGNKLGLGITHSNSGFRESPIRMYLGVETQDISVVLTQVPFEKKHTVFLDLDKAMSDGLDAWEKQAHYTNEIMRVLQTTEVLPFEAEQLLLNAARRKFLSWGRIGVVDSHFRASNKQTYWNLLVAYTKGASKSPALQQMKSVAKFINTFPIALPR